MSVPDIVKLITESGFTIVFLSVAMFFILKFGTSAWRKWDAKTTEQRHESLEERRDIVSRHINRILEDALLKTKASRAYVFELCNGSYAKGGLPFSKMTCTYEASAPGISPQYNNRQLLPVSVFQPFLDEAYAQKYVITDVELPSKELTPVIYETLKERGVLYTIRAKFCDMTGSKLGFLGLDYCTKRPDDITEQEAISEVQEMAVKVGALLSVNDKSNEGGKK